MTKNQIDQISGGAKDLESVPRRNADVAVSLVASLRNIPDLAVVLGQQDVSAIVRIQGSADVAKSVIAHMSQGTEFRSLALSLRGNTPLVK